MILSLGFSGLLMTMLLYILAFLWSVLVSFLALLIFGVLRENRKTKRKARKDGE